MKHEMMNNNNGRVKAMAFEQLVEKRSSTKKWAYILVSIIIHGMVGIGVIVYPLMSLDSNIPVVKIFDVSLTTVAPPVPAVPIARKGGSSHPKDKPKTVETVAIHRFVAPLEIPTEVPEESFSNLGNGSGGIDGGIKGEDIGLDLPIDVPGYKSDTLFEQPLKIADVQTPRIIKRVNPSYPQIALKAHIQGIVVIDAVTDVYGHVVSVNVVTGHPLLKQSAVDAVKQWVYEPYILNGIPRPVKFCVNVTFTLQQ